MTNPSKQISSVPPWAPSTVSRFAVRSLSMTRVPRRQSMSASGNGNRSASRSTPCRSASFVRGGRLYGKCCSAPMTPTYPVQPVARSCCAARNPATPAPTTMILCSDKELLLPRDDLVEEVGELALGVALVLLDVAPHPLLCDLRVSRLQG